VATAPVVAWRIEERLGGVRITSWIDGEGRLVKSESPLGFTVERTSYELSQWEWQRSRADRGTRSGYGLIIESTAIASRADLRATQSAEELSFLLRGVELEGFDLDGGRQVLRGDTLVVRRETAYRDAGYELPYRGGGEPAGELASTPLIQASDPAMVRRAEQIAGGSRDPAEVARRLNGWVYRELRKEITPSVPSAIQVLEARRGDCNEHTVLFVALARALGLPARTAVGVVHLRGSFYYHAWPEVWLGGWVAVDPTLGQFPADAAHLRFLVGGLARQIELIRLVGRLDIEVL
jgi:transglutaminase-like putative cysteine protease